MDSNHIIKVRWNKDYFSVDNTHLKTILDLKNEMQKHSQVQSDEQLLILKGKVLQDSDNISIVPPNSLITMLGASAKGPEKRVKPEVTFEEDLTQEQRMQILREKGEEIVFGLNNLGNTCYLNSTIQCLGRVPELRTALKNYSTENTNAYNSVDPSKKLTYAWGSTYHMLDKATEPVTPMRLVQVIRAINPMFAEADHGVCKQQDADECLSLLINNIHDTLKTPGDKTDVFSKVLVDELFGIEMQVQMKNVEDTTEVKSKKELLYKLICYIDNSTLELVEGLKKSLKENLDLFSDKLQRNTVFEKSQYINRLPNYLTVQFMRFFWKKANTLTGAKAGKSKILKSVIFSKIIDLYDMCTEETKELLNLGRKIESKLLKDDKNFKIENVKKEEGKEYVPTGRYQLISVLTHQGRSSESGHYIGWVHKIDDKWLKYDDDNVTMVSTNDVLELKGGGDWHMAYICIFRQLEVPIMDIE
jgi:ubiquitin carboxyl-terminal hydrolase 14